MAIEFKGNLRAIDFINEQESMVKSMLLKLIDLMLKDEACKGMKRQDFYQMNLGDFFKTLSNFREKYQLESKFDFLGE